ncbi:TonB-dependent receptor plug domain-containing protein [Hansschlegelia zhihuaiae]|uniref:TonB-dependent receptor n=1 Tax=Hansschlegelia zhihuaiae TaxID=405005 RepID=A0A4Q0M933_9HYPH|nr:TonB-dependent receptor [Hansschlegelia zhihuaiae]RXF69246.1 TonB-dependent receptor [Hansschlegelia zhihuaiae]
MSNLPIRLRGAVVRSAAFAAVHACLISAAAAQSVPDGAVTDLEELSLTANKVDGPTAAIGSAVSSLSGEDLERRQIRLVSDALREMPGVAVNRTGPIGGLTQLRIRGAEGNQTLVLIDGIEVNDPATAGEFDFANLMSLEVERVDVLRGPQSALYGSDALGGVVNIVTRKSEPGSTRFRASVEGGSFRTMTGQASISGGTEAYDYLIAGQGFRTSGVSTARRFADPAVASWRDRDGYENATGLAKFSVRPSELFEITGVARYAEFDADRDGFGSAPGFPFAAAVDNRDREKGEQFFGRTQARATLLDGAWDHILGLSYTNSDRRQYDGDGLKTSSSLGETRKVDYQSNLRFATGGRLPASHVLTFGADNQRDWTVGDSTFLPEKVRKSIENTGLVAQHQIGLFERLFVTASVRHDLNDRFKDETTYRLASAYTLEGVGAKLRASFGTGVKNPTVQELYGFSGDFRGNADLTPERGRGWDVGFDQPFLDGRVAIDATYFQQRVKDLISSESTKDRETGEFFSRPINLPGMSKIDGVELGLTVRPLADLSVRAAYAVIDGEDVNGDTLVRQPRHVASLNFNYAFLDGRGNANLGVVHNSRQKNFAFDATTFVRSQVPLKAYTLVNVAASFEVTDNAEVYGRVENLFDRKYEEVFTYGTPGRAAFGGVKVSF